MMSLFRKKANLDFEAQEKLSKEENFKTKLLINKTKSELQDTIDRLKKEKNAFIEIAKKAKLALDEQSYKSSYVGWKITQSSLIRANTMLSKLSITEHMREISQISRNFSLSMLDISRKFSDITKDESYSKIEKNFQSVMKKLNKTDTNLKHLIGIDPNLKNVNSNQLEDLSDQMDEEFTSLIEEGLIDLELKELNKIQSKIKNDDKQKDFLNKKIEDIKTKLGNE